MRRVKSDTDSRVDQRLVVEAIVPVAWLFEMGRMKMGGSRVSTGRDHIVGPSGRALYIVLVAIRYPSARW